ncbi:hypothetical protein E2320_001147 [Naja naja]|nr:hypothetical protein E2320_001147 [Naja naja]
MTLLHATGTPTNQTTEALEAKVIPTVFLTMSFLIGAPGNGLVIWTILSKLPQRFFTIALILNLAVADLLVILTVPFWTYYFVKGWVFGDFMCRFLMYLVYLTVYTSIFSIIGDPVAFVIPFALLAVCYTYVARKIRTLKNHKEMKTRKLIAAVVGAFFVCWLPYHILNLIIISALLLRHAKPEVSQNLLESIKTLTNIHGVVAFVSSCINPILYAFAAWSFRGGLRETNFAKLFEKLRNDTEEKLTKDNTILQTL